MRRITKQDVEKVLNNLNAMLPKHEVFMCHFHEDYELHYKAKGVRAIHGVGDITSGTKRDCYEVVRAMIKAVELSNLNT